MSLPSRERGLKYKSNEVLNDQRNVAPFAGAWIEMTAHWSVLHAYVVAPFAGAWIEILVIR